MRRSLPGLILMLAALTVFGPSLRATQPQTPSFHQELHAKLEAALGHAAGSLNGVMGYAIRDLSSRESFTRNADLVFPTASSIKLAILAELLRQAQQGKIRLSEERTIHQSETVGGSGILDMLGDGTVMMSWRDLATLMVVESDNSATNILMGRLGMASINAESRRLGLPHTLLRRRMMDLHAAQQGNENVSTPRELSGLLAKVYAGQALDAAHTQEYFRILGLPKESPFHAALPDNVRLADKPGELAAVRCDAGIVFIPGHPFVITVMTSYLKDDSEGERAIEEIARRAYGYFDRLAQSSSYGRRMPR